MAQERASAAHLLVLDTGDALVGGGPLGDLTQGEAIVAGMGLMGYDAMALGPNELGLGLDVLRQRMAEARFPLLSANVVLVPSDELLALPYVLVEAGTHSIGILGLTRTPEVPIDGIQVLNPREALVQFLPQLAAEADVTILLTNLPYEQVLALAAEHPGIDLAVAALPEQPPSGAARLPDTGTIVVTAEQPLPRHTGRQIGRTSVIIQPDGELVGEIWTAVPMDLDVSDDPAMAELLARFQP